MRPGDFEWSDLRHFLAVARTGKLTLAARHGTASAERQPEPLPHAHRVTTDAAVRGLGESDDDVITLAGEVEDLQAAANWLAGGGWTWPARGELLTCTQGLSCFTRSWMRLMRRLMFPRRQSLSRWPRP